MDINKIFIRNSYKINLGLKYAILCALIIFFASTIHAQSKVTMEEQSLTIPTYLVGPPEKDPIFYTGRIYQGAQGHVYPYPMYNDLTNIKKDRQYKVVVLENKYIKFTVAPQLGGRILSALDKTDQYDFFYHQHVIKPALIGMIGAWISGGVEWNIPDHHRASSFLPVDYTLQENPDGSKTVWVGESVLSRGLKWTIGLTLYPERSYIEATVKIFNPSPFAQSFLYWANASVAANKNYQVIFPPETQFGVQHAKSEFVTWPVGNGRYGGADLTDVNLSWWKNIPTPLSVFAWKSTGNFLAGYDHGKEAGTVHVANHHIVEGKKFFAWGNNKEAEMWRKMLTDTDGAYLELMTGAYSNNQPDYSWIDPGETRVFKHYWYPISKIGGVKNANINAAVNLERESPDSIKAGFYTTSVFKQAQVIVSLNNKDYFKKNITIGPAKPYLKLFYIPSSVKDTGIKISLLDRGGNKIISYSPDQLKKMEMPKPVKVPRPPKEYNSNQELYLTGLRLEQFRNAVISPLPYYKEALNRDSLDYLVNNALGMIYCKEGRFEDAEKSYMQSIKRLTKNYTTPKNGEAFYYLGVTLQFEHRYDEAADAFWKATWYHKFQNAAYYRLAQIACLRQDYSKALDIIDRSIVTNGLNTSAIALKAYILRTVGDFEVAKKTCLLAQSIDKLNNWSAAEMFFIDADQHHQKKWSKNNIDLFKSRMKGNVQSVLALALKYGNIGAYDEAIQILDQYHNSGEKQSDFPLLFYYMGYYEMKKENLSASKRYFEKAAQASPNYCFPFRLDGIEILTTAAEVNPSDAMAFYYLGNIFYSLGQKEKAIDNWEKSVQLNDDFYLAFRNLGFAYYQTSHNLKKAIPAYEKAINLNSKDALLFAELDVLKEEAEVSPEKRIAFLEQYISTVKKSDPAIVRLIKLYNITGAYEKALAILTTRHFHVWEGSRAIHNVFVNTNLLKGIEELRRRQYNMALKDFKRAATYPDNLEVGEPYDGGRNAQINYYIALAFEKLKNNTMAKKYYSKAALPLFDQGPSVLSFYRGMALKRINQTKSADTIFNKIENFASNQLTSVDEIDFFSKFGSETNQSVQLANLHYLLGLAYNGKGYHQKASGQFKKAIALNPNQIWARVMQNEILMKKSMNMGIENNK